MKVAVLADIHGNINALETVAEHIEGWGADAVVVAGDVINRGPLPLACLTFVQQRQHSDGWLVVRGNHEDYVLDQEFKNYELNLAKKILGKAQQNWDESNYSEAFITVVSALELAIGLFIKNRVPSDNNIYSNLENVFMRKKPKISLVEQVATVFTIKEDFELNIIEKALDGITLRNDIIHRGQERVTEENIDEFSALSKCVQSLIFKPHFKYPIFTTSNSIDHPK